jgi:hypothetical protein
VHKESPLARNEADLARLKKSSEGAVPQEPLISCSRAALAEQIEGVAASYVMDMSRISLKFVADSTGNWWII